MNPLKELAPQVGGGSRDHWGGRRSYSQDRRRTVRIEPNRVSRLASRPANEVGRAEADATRSTQGVVQTDQVVLSQRASEVQLARASLASVPEVRARKVAELKRQIQAGTYRVDADAVAEKLIKGGA